MMLTDAERDSLLDRIGTDCRDKRPMSGRWVGRAVAYRASASKLRALGEGSTDA